MDASETTESTSLDGSQINDTNNHNSQNLSASSVKTGRKGDPRMHRAVAARMENPHLSLFDALRVGGFEYTHDDDANLVDPENVTLAQRKNQLSRRVRLMRQQRIKKIKERGFGNSNSNDQNKPKGTTKLATACRKDFAVKKGPDDSEGKTNFLSDEDYCDNQKDSPKSDASSPTERKERLAKFHPQYNPILVPPLINGTSKTAMNSDETAAAFDTTGARNNTPSTATNASTGGRRQSQLDQQQTESYLSGNGNQSKGMKRTFSGKIARIAAPEPATDEEESALAKESAAGGNSTKAATQSGNQTKSKNQESSIIGAPSTNQAAASLSSISQMLMFPSRAAVFAAAGSPVPHNPLVSTSGVAIASLAQTASSVGMSIEQLAIALQNCRNLSQILLSSGGSAFSQSRQDLALALYQSENMALYQRAMLLSGYPADVALGEAASSEYLQFALSCWQAEGKRLQKLVNQQQQDQISKAIFQYF